MGRAAVEKGELGTWASRVATLAFAPDTLAQREIIGKGKIVGKRNEVGMRLGYASW